MRCRAGLVAGLLCVAAALVGGRSTAVASDVSATALRQVGTACKGAREVRCLTVEVPLDRAGRVPGKVLLHVEVLPPPGRQRGVVFLVAGGPGQAATEVFDLRSTLVPVVYQTAFPGYALVSIDARGTGRSGSLRCAETGSDGPDDPSRVARCAALLGPRRDLYGTADNAEDLEAVRRALGVRAIALAAVSYGTEVAVAYARAHPARVERLLLDSVALIDRPDPFAGRALSRIPATLRRFCAHDACRSATPDFAGDVAALANTLEKKPLRGRVRLGSGAVRTVRITGFDFLFLVLDADLNPGLAVELPAAVRSARTGDPRPLLRLSSLTSGGDASAGVNDGVYFAAVCRDGHFPWRPGTPLAERRALVDSAVEALPARALGGFGAWAARVGDAFACLEWPSPDGGTMLSDGPFPDVPVLVLSGAFDMRTPTADAATLVSRFPHGHLLVFPGVGHSVLSNDATGCALGAVRDWVTDHVVDWRQGCPRRKPFLMPLTAFPSAGAAAGGAATRSRTLGLAEKTLHEALATWLLTLRIDGGGTTVAGVEHGTVASSLQRIRLTEYAIAPGVSLTGDVRLTSFTPFRFAGTLTVRGPRAAAGTIVVDGERLRGTLGGQAVPERAFCVLQC